MALSWPLPSVRAAEWSIEPAVLGGYTYNDNLLLKSESSQPTGAGNLDLVANLAWQTENRQLKLLPRARFLRYDGLDDLDSDDQYLDLTYNVSAETHSWQLAGNFARDTTLTSELEDSGFVDAGKRHELGAVSALSVWNLTERVLLTAQAGGQTHHYVDAADTGLVDYRYGSALAAVSRSFTERTRLGAELSAGTLDPDSLQPDSRDQSARLTFEHQLTTGLHLSLAGGVNRSDSAGVADEGTVYSFELARAGERNDWHIAAEQRVIPSSRGILVRHEEVEFGVSRRLTAHLRAALSARHSVNQDLTPGVVGADRDYDRADASVTWQFASTWGLGAGASFARQSFAGSDDVAENLAFSLNLRWTPLRTAISR